MRYFIPRFFVFDGFETIDIQVSTRDKTTKIYLKAKKDRQFNCHVCGTKLSHFVHKKPRTVKDLPTRGFATSIHFERRTGYCSNCEKNRVEAIDFISPLSPHFTKEYSWWLAEMCEFSTVRRAAKFTDIDNMTMRRLDHKRMLKMVQSYKIPEAIKIAVDEVYARKKQRSKDESRNKKFFTVVSDLATRKVIWVTESRDKSALDEFFEIIGPSACEKIEVVAADQHDPYRASVRQYCKNAVVVWDRFHVVKTFEEAINETRKDLHHELGSKSPLYKMTRGKYRYMFLKRAERRTKQEKEHIDDILLENVDFSQLELIKEKMLSFFDQRCEADAKQVFKQVGDWIWQKQFRPLMRWYNALEKEWDTLVNYFKYRVTSALAEGINNVIKSLKRQAFGYRNMDYFRLKIMQRCGYLNSEHMPLAV